MNFTDTPSYADLLVCKAAHEAEHAANGHTALAAKLQADSAALILKCIKESGR